MPHPDRPPDAVIAPPGMVPIHVQPQFFRNKFGPLMGLKPGQKLYVRNQGPFHFMTADPTDSLFFGTLHELAAQERYDWYVVAPDARFVTLPVPIRVTSHRDDPDSVKFGWLKDEDALESFPASVRAEYLRVVGARRDFWKRKTDRHNELALAQQEGPLSRDEQEEFDAIGAMMDKLAEEGLESVFPALPGATGSPLILP